jgi:hypothetical protein
MLLLRESTQPEYTWPLAHPRLNKVKRTVNKKKSLKNIAKTG